MSAKRLVRVRGFAQAGDQLFNYSLRILRKQVAPELAIYFRQLLTDNKQTTGKPMPEKQAATKQSYAKLGADQNHYLIRFGVSAQILSRNIKRGVRLYLRDPKVIGYHVPERVRWFEMNKEARKILTGTMQKALLKRYNRRAL